MDSLVWRDRWEETGDSRYKELLLAYNEADCQALRRLADELRRLHEVGAEEPLVDFTARPKRHATAAGNQIHRQFETILRSAHLEYERARINLRDNRPGAPQERRGRGGRPGHQGYGRSLPRARRVVQVSQRRVCPRCEHPLEASTRMAERTIIDLTFSDNGCRKTITKYQGPQGYCRRCGQHYPPPEISALGQRLFGHGFQAWVIYQRLMLRLPYGVIQQVLGEQSGEWISQGSIDNFMGAFVEYYVETADQCRRQLLHSAFVHVDETKLNIRGVDHYAWVFTDGRHVLFRLTATREGAGGAGRLRGCPRQ